MATVLILCAVFGAGIAADQLLKSWAISALAGGTEITVIPGFFTLTYVENRGAAFGIFQNARVFFLIVTAVITAAALWLMLKSRFFTDFLSRLCLTLIITGGIGNAIDRVIRSFVVDYMKFEFPFFPWVFNLADVFVVCATIGLLLIFLFSKEKDRLFAARKEEKQ